jgi:hypothetical protein
MELPGYVHVLNGRLRIKVPEVKRAPRKALHVEMLIGSMDGVIRASANVTTGNLLVLFAPERLSHHDIIVTLRKADYLRWREQPAAIPASCACSSGFGQVIARSVTEAVVHRMLSALL